MNTSNTLIQSSAPADAPASHPPQSLAQKPQPPLPLAFSFTRKIAENMFGLDYRSLALLRLAMAACLLWVAYVNALNMRVFYSDDGVLPRVGLYNIYNEFPGFSLHYAHGSLAYIAILFTLQFIFAFLMLIGYRTRIATVASYILLLSMQNRHPILIYGADIVMRVGLFWMMFLPLNRCFSLDRLTGRVAAPAKRPFLGFAGIALILQLAAIYTFGALMKVGESWQVDHNAVAYALALDVYSRPLGRWLLQFPALTTFLTIFTLYFEKYGPLLFVFPIFSKWSRLLGILLFSGLQIGFGLCMVLGYFGPAMITLTLAFLPPFFWERLALPLARWMARKCNRFTARIATWTNSSALAAWFRRWLACERARNAARFPWHRLPGAAWARFAFTLARESALILLICLMIFFNISNLPGKQSQLSPRYANLAYNLGINQTWNMFAPTPMSNDGWFVVAGTLNNGTTVDLLSGVSPVSYDRPDSVADSYQSQLWMSYLIPYLWQDSACDPASLTQYLAAQWNQNHPPAEQLKRVEFSEMYEEVEDGPSKSDVTRIPLWTQWFGDPDPPPPTSLPTTASTTTQTQGRP